MNLNLTTSEIIVTLFCLLLIILANKFGDSSKNTAWMFFLGPIGLFIFVVYWFMKIVLL
jgi:hypothetical protein